MKNLVKRVVVVLVVMFLMPDIGLCKKKSAEDNIYNPYYDLLAQAPMGMPVQKEPIIPDTMTGKKAIGYSGIPGLFDGISFKYWMKDKMAVNVNANINLETGGLNTPEYIVNLRPRILMNFIKSDSLLVNMFAGCDILFEGNRDHTLQGSTHIIYIFAGISPELFLTKNISIETSFGVKLGLLGSIVDWAGTRYSSFTIGTFGATLDMTSISFHIYF